MRARTRILLYELLALAEFVYRPTWSKATESLEHWAWRNGLGPHLAELERLKFIEDDPSCAGAGNPPPLDRVFRLTEAGRAHALGGRDPESAWSRAWDGQWRLIIFDLPANRPGLRSKLTRYLKVQRYGHLQYSLWLTPDPIDEVSRTLSKLPKASRALVFFEGRPRGGESDLDLVRTSWSFTAINAAYNDYLNFLDGDALSLPPPDWLLREREAWQTAAASDPFLPRELYPPNYLGFQAWHRRREAFLRLGSASAKDRPPSTS